MKKNFSTLVFFLCVSVTFAQKLVIPEYNGQTAIVGSDSTTTLLPKESASMKTKSSHFGMIPLPGTSLLDKTKVNVSIPGAESSVSASKGDVTLVYRIGDNNNDPKTLLQVVRFEVKKKDRLYTYADASVVKGVQYKGQAGNVQWTASKYGSNCYIINIPKMEEGQYGIVFAGDFTHISTFGVK